MFRFIREEDDHEAVIIREANAAKGCTFVMPINLNGDVLTDDFPIM
jgi:hypothetical protein